MGDSKFVDFQELDDKLKRMMSLKGEGELLNCDKCGTLFYTKNKYRFYCEDCWTIMRMQDEIKTRNWADHLVRRQWNREAKENRQAILEKYGNGGKRGTIG